ncbi:hypothetical protein [Halobellus captivus]|uniref:hypothetical protein n=1 Tax=Halobellus captivus TaxID=2592614 RepID=UPI0019394096|nr:hypothetical protein [Halobellus captivus]
MSASKAVAIVAILVATAMWTVPSGGFGVVDQVRDAQISVAGTGNDFVHVEAADSVDPTGPAELLTVTNHLQEPVEVTVTLPGSNDGELRGSESGADEGREFAFSLSPGQQRTVYISGIQGASSDPVKVEVTAETAGGTTISMSEEIPKTPGDGEDDDNDEGGDDDGDDDGDNDDDDDDDDDDHRGNRGNGHD